MAMTKGHYKNLIGFNFLVNPSVLFDKNLTYQIRAEYVGLCSLRRISDYSVGDKTTLHVSKVPPWVPAEIVTNNPLIEIKDNHLHFLTEDTNI